MRILGIRVDEYNMKETVELLMERSAAPSYAFPAQVVTINPEGIMLAREDAAFQRVIEEAFLVTPDGTGVLWAAKRLGAPLQERVTGIDLLEALAAQAAQKGRTIYLLGAKPGYAEKAADVLQQRYPGLQVVGCADGYFRGQEAETIARIRKAAPDILFAALGMPYQDKWLHAHGPELGCSLMMGVGGSFDVLAGAVKRAPRLIQRIRMEWLWRLLSDPKRWRRYLAIPRYMWAVQKERRAMVRKK